MGDFMMSRTFPWFCHNINVVNPDLFADFASNEGCESVFLCLRFMPLAVWNPASNDLSLSRVATGMVLVIATDMFLRCDCGLTL
jgi:hypothetical protein